PRGGDQEGTPAALPVRAKRLRGHRNHLVSGGGSRRLHPVARPPRPGEISFTVEGTGPQRLEAKIVAEGSARLVVRDGADLLEPVRASERGLARGVHEIEQRRLLHSTGAARHALERPAAVCRVDAKRRAPDSLDHERPPGRAPRAWGSTSTQPTAA